jgi:hypothetical protein
VQRLETKKNYKECSNETRRLAYLVKKHKTIPENMRDKYDFCDREYEPRLIIEGGYLIYKFSDFRMIRISDCSQIFLTTGSQTYISGSHEEHDSSKDKSVVGSAVAGGLLFGGVGAVVGAVSAADKNARNMNNTKTVNDYSVRSVPAIGYELHGKKYVDTLSNNINVRTLQCAISEAREKYPYRQ